MPSFLDVVHVLSPSRLEQLEAALDRFTVGGLLVMLNLRMYVLSVHRDVAQIAIEFDCVDATVLGEPLDGGVTFVVAWDLNRELVHLPRYMLEKIRELFIHEIDEGLLFDGRWLSEPHPGEPSARVNPSHPAHIRDRAPYGCDLAVGPRRLYRTARRQ